ncbi:unnamed protein product [Amoebophrya sp. A120]|nr:unnamed protein product [Amoebophrya sp. A120]|eukprot:GSA120T00013029001.1
MMPRVIALVFLLSFVADGASGQHFGADAALDELADEIKGALEATGNALALESAPKPVNALQKQEEETGGQFSVVPAYVNEKDTSDPSSGYLRLNFVAARTTSRAVVRFVLPPCVAVQSASSAGSSQCPGLQLDPVGQKDSARCTLTNFEGTPLQTPCQIRTENNRNVAVFSLGEKDGDVPPKVYVYAHRWDRMGVNGDYVFVPSAKETQEAAAAAAKAGAKAAPAPGTATSAAGAPENKNTKPPATPMYEFRQANDGPFGIFYEDDGRWVLRRRDKDTVVLAKTNAIPTDVTDKPAWPEAEGVWTWTYATKGSDPDEAPPLLGRAEGGKDSSSRTGETDKGTNEKDSTTKFYALAVKARIRLPSLLDNNISAASSGIKASSATEASRETEQQSESKSSLMLPSGPSFESVLSPPDGKLMFKDATFELQIQYGHDRSETLSFKAHTPWGCVYGDWVPTTQCAARCNRGRRMFKRSLRHEPAGSLGSTDLMNCHSGPMIKFEDDCGAAPCDVNCRLGPWKKDPGADCSASCGGGMLIERRQIVQPNQGRGIPCPPIQDSSRVRYSACNLNPCKPVCDTVADTKSLRRATLPQAAHTWRPVLAAGRSLADSKLDGTSSTSSSALELQVERRGDPHRAQQFYDAPEEAGILAKATTCSDKEVPEEIYEEDEGDLSGTSMLSNGDQPANSPVREMIPWSECSDWCSGDEEETPFQFWYYPMKQKDFTSFEGRNVFGWRGSSKRRLPSRKDGLKLNLEEATKMMLFPDGLRDGSSSQNVCNKFWEKRSCNMHPCGDFRVFPYSHLLAPLGNRFARRGEWVETVLLFSVRSPGAAKVVVEAPIGFSFQSTTWGQSTCVFSMDGWASLPEGEDTTREDENNVPCEVLCKNSGGKAATSSASSSTSSSSTASASSSAVQEQQSASGVSRSGTTTVGAEIKAASIASSATEVVQAQRQGETTETQKQQEASAPGASVVGAPDAQQCSATNGRPDCRQIRVKLHRAPGTTGSYKAQERYVLRIWVRFPDHIFYPVENRWTMVLQDHKGQMLQTMRAPGIPYDKRTLAPFSQGPFALQLKGPVIDVEDARHK